MNNADAQLSGRWVRFRAIEPEDYPHLRQAEVASSVALRWRLQGQHVAPEQYAESLWNGTLATFLYESVTPGPGVGVVSAYAADPRHGHAYIAAARLHPFGGTLRDAVCTVEAIVLFVDFIFQGWNFRKLYFECAEYNTNQFASFLEQCRQEANLQEHLYLDGRFWNLGTWALARDDWPAIRSVLDRPSSE